MKSMYSYFSSFGCEAFSEKVITSLKSCFFTEVLNMLASLAWRELGANQLTSELTTP